MCMSRSTRNQNAFHPHQRYDTFTPAVRQIMMLRQEADFGNMLCQALVDESQAAG